MAIQLNHTIVHAHDKHESARFLTDLLGLPEPRPFGPFVGVELGNGVTLDYAQSGGDIAVQHYAFLVSEDVFDAAFSDIQERGLDFWADPNKSRPGEINTNDGGRGVYFDDPGGHRLELITRPYGGGAPLPS